MKAHLGTASLVLMGLAVLLLAISGPGTRFEVWNFRVGLLMMRIAAFVAIAGGVAGIAALIAGSPGRAGPIMAIVTALVLVGGGLKIKSTAGSLPMIHDISTDTERPPEFFVLHPAPYGGPEVAAQQRQGYPDLAPLVLPAPAQKVFERAIEVARELGWEVAGTDAAAGRIEATDTTFLFGFKDDVAIRVAADGPAKTRVDARSVSRVGKSDLGKNAARIREFFKRLGA